MKKNTLIWVTLFLMNVNVFAQAGFDKHPNTSGKGWHTLFNKDITNAIYPQGVWSVERGVMTATKDEAIWSEKQYDDFILDLEFKNAPGTNSGVIVHATETEEWIPHSVEIQIADDYSEQWSKAEPNWQCAAIFGHQPVTKRTVKPAGEWNHFTVTCKGQKIWIVLNGELVNECDMSLFTSATVNPDSTKIPSWLKNPMATLTLHGHIG
ncbi:MAG: DUF1080 domain-containing protein, partial [Panacibacter sp.]